MTDMAIGGVSGVVFILGIVWAVKQINGFPTNLSALLSIVLGLLWGLAVYYRAPDGKNVVDSIIAGLAIGLSASGFYSGTKATVAYARGDKGTTTPTPLPSPAPTRNVEPVTPAPEPLVTPTPTASARRTERLERDETTE